MKLASAVFLGLTLDEVENNAIESRWQRRNSDGDTHDTTGSHTDRQSKLVNERLSELRAQD